MCGCDLCAPRCVPVCRPAGVARVAAVTVRCVGPVTVHCARRRCLVRRVYVYREVSLPADPEHQQQARGQNIGYNMERKMVRRRSSPNTHAPQAARSGRACLSRLRSWGSRVTHVIREAFRTAYTASGISDHGERWAAGRFFRRADS